MASLHVGGVEHPDHLAGRDLRVVDGLESVVVAALGEAQGDDTLIDEAEQDLLERRPVEPAEVLVAEEPVGALVQRDEHERVLVDVARAHAPVDGERHQPVARLEHLLRLAELVEHEPAGAAHACRRGCRRAPWSRRRRSQGCRTLAMESCVHCESWPGSTPAPRCRPPSSSSACPARAACRTG